MNRKSEKAVNDAIQLLSDAIMESEDFESCTVASNVIEVLQKSLKSSEESHYYYCKKNRRPKAPEKLS